MSSHNAQVAHARHVRVLEPIEVQGGELDSISLSTWADLAEELLVADRFDEAICHSERQLTLDPFFTPACNVRGHELVQIRNKPHQSGVSRVAWLRNKDEKEKQL